MKQVDKKHYDFSNYSHIDRWVSYYHQLDEIFKINPESVLEIGVGDRVIGNYISDNTQINYKSIDIDPDLKPHVVGSVLELPFENNSFSTSCAFEVLEHIPFEDFDKALSELCRVSKNYVLLSLPHFGPPIQFLLKIPFLKRIKFSFKIPYSRKHEFNGEHYWEIGKKGYPPKVIRNKLKKYFYIKKEFIPFESQYHHFFVLTPRK